MVRQRDRLRMLHVRHARHGNAKHFFCLAHEGADQACDGSARLGSGFLYEHAEICGHKFIAAATRMQFVTERPKIFDQSSLDKMMNVLGRRVIQPCGIACRALGNFVEGGQSVAHFLHGKNAGRDERAGPDAVHRQFVRQQAAIERKRALKLVEQLVGSAVKPPAPQFS